MTKSANLKGATVYDSGLNCLLSGEKNQKTLTHAGFDLLTLSADFYQLALVPRIRKRVGLVEEDVFARNPLDGKTS